MHTCVHPATVFVRPQLRHGLLQYVVKPWSLLNLTSGCLVLVTIVPHALCMGVSEDVHSAIAGIQVRHAATLAGTHACLGAMHGAEAVGAPASAAERVCPNTCTGLPKYTRHVWPSVYVCTHTVHRIHMPQPAGAGA